MECSPCFLGFASLSDRCCSAAWATMTLFVLECIIPEERFRAAVTLSTARLSGHEGLQKHHLLARVQMLHQSLQQMLCLRSLDYHDIVCDGVYDPRGAFSELQSPSARSIFPGLNDLRSIPFWQGDSREVHTNSLTSRMQALVLPRHVRSLSEWAPVPQHTLLTCFVISKV